MARTTPLPPRTDVRKLIGGAGARPGGGEDDFYWLTLEAGAGAARYNLPGYGAKLRGPRLAPRRVDDPLLGLMRGLRPHFDHVELVRFRHAPGGRPTAPDGRPGN